MTLSEGYTRRDFRDAFFGRGFNSHRLHHFSFHSNSFRGNWSQRFALRAIPTGATVREAEGAIFIAPFLRLEEA